MNAVRLLLVVFEDSILLPHVPPQEPSCTRPRCRYDRDIPLICLTKYRCDYKEYNTSISFQLSVVRQRSGLIEHRETGRVEMAVKMQEKKDFS